MSRAVSLALFSLALGAAGGALAQPAAPANFTLPRAFAGYSQPEITDCTNSGELERTCVVPAMTAGRYVIVAQDGATSTAAGATMTMVILLNGSPCVALKSQPFTGKKGLPAGCQVSVLTDEPMRVTARFAVEHATADAGGPHMVIQRAPWNGLLDVRGGQVAMRQPAAPAAAAK